MRRRFFAVVSAVSLLLCLAAATLWAAQLNRTLAIGNHYTTITVEVADCFYFSLWKYTFDVKASSKIERPFIRFRGDGWLVEEVETDGVGTGQFSLGRTRFFNRPQKQALVLTRYFLKVPFWFLSAVFFVLPFHWVVSRRWQPSSKGKCHVCGYNLTGNTSGVCPECGTTVAGKAGVKA